MKQRLDAYLAVNKLVPTRSQAEGAIKLGNVRVNGRVVTKPGTFVSEKDEVRLSEKERYVSRAGLKLASVAQLLGVDFMGKTVLDVGSSTGGFTDFSLQHGARKVWAVDVGTEQLHPSLRGDARIELHEKTDIRSVTTNPNQSATTLLSSLATPGGVGGVGSYDKGFPTSSASVVLGTVPDIVVMDVSFISLREILPHIAKSLSNKNTQIVAMLKPQFEAGKHQVNKGVIKNDAVRRQILRDFEDWSRQYFVIQDKRDSEVAGAKGNRERFYLLKTTH